jgi:peroxiredoxin
MSILTPGAQAPALRFHTAAGSTWTLDRQAPRSFTLVAFYRGVFCPYCRAFIATLDRLAGEYRSRGIEPVAVSVDTQENAKAAIAQWKLTSLPVGYGLDLDVARQWGLFVTQFNRDGRTVRFTEPGVFLIRPGNEIYAMLLNSLPCGRPDLPSLLEGLDYLAQQGYPARGSA